MSTDANLTVSVIIPMFNAEETIEATVKSIQSQSYRNFEIIICDDASTDQSVEIVRNLSKTMPEINLILKSKNSGVADTRNVAISHAKGRFLAFCDADDYWYEAKLEVQVKEMLENKAAISFTRCERLYKNSIRVNSRKSILRYPSFRDMLFRNHIVNSTSMIDLTMLPKPEQKNIKHEDYAMWLNYYKTEPKVIGIDKTLVTYRVREQSLSSNKLKSLFWHYRVLRSEENLNIVGSFYFTIVGRIKLAISRLSERR